MHKCKKTFSIDHCVFVCRRIRAHGTKEVVNWNARFCVLVKSSQHNQARSRATSNGSALSRNSSVKVYRTHQQRGLLCVCLLRLVFACGVNWSRCSRVEKSAISSSNDSVAQLFERSNSNAFRQCTVCGLRLLYIYARTTHYTLHKPQLYVCSSAASC